MLRTNRAFQISQVFAPAEQTDQLLALYALFAAVEEACSDYSDEEVARRKLHWWRSACLRLESDAGDRITDLHCWSIGPGIFAADIAIVSDNPKSPDDYRSRIPEKLGIVHVTLEIHRCKDH